MFASDTLGFVNQWFNGTTPLTSTFTGFELPLNTISFNQAAALLSNTNVSGIAFGLTTSDGIKNWYGFLGECLNTCLFAKNLVSSRLDRIIFIIYFK